VPSTVPASLRTALDTATPRLAVCWKIVPRFAPTVAGISLDQDVEVDLGDGDGPLVYKATNSIDRTNIAKNIDLQVDNHDISGLLLDGFDADDLDAGVYDRARVTIFGVKWDAGNDDVVILDVGHVGEVSRLDRESFSAEVRGLVQAYAQDLMKTFGDACPVDLGGTECGVVGVKTDAPLWAPSAAVTTREDGDAKTGDTVRPSTYNGFYFEAQSDFTTGGSEPTWVASLGALTSDGGGSWKAVRALRMPSFVLSVINQRRLIVDVPAPGVLDDTFIKRGLLVFQPGALNALTKPHGIKNFDPYSGEVKLFRPLPFPVNADDNSTDPDQLVVQTGCRKTMTFCSDHYNNWENYRGYGLYVPGLRRLLETPFAS